MHVPAGLSRPSDPGGGSPGCVCHREGPAYAAGSVAIMFAVGGLMVSSVPYCNAKKMKKDNVNKVKLYGR